MAESTKRKQKELKRIMETTIFTNFKTFPTLLYFIIKHNKDYLEP